MKDKLRADRCVLVMDVGGSNLVTAVVSNSGKVFPARPAPKTINALGKQAYLVKKITAELVSTMEKYSHLKLVGVGIGLPGTLDQKRGMLVIKNPKKKTKYSALYNIRLRDLLENKLKLPVFFANDADAFALGESWIGKAKGYRRVIGITLGTGIGAGFIVSSKIITTGNGAPPGGELWRLKFKNGIVGDYFESSLAVDRYLSLRKEHGYVAKNISLKEVSSRAHNNDSDALETFRNLGNLLGEALSPVIKSFRPNVIVCGGQVSKSFDLFHAQFQKTVVEKGGKKIKIFKAKLGDKASLYGAAKLAFNKFNLA